MDLHYIGVDPESGHSGSPTVWVDYQAADIVLQSYRADEATTAWCAARPAPGHTTGVPEHETVVRVPVSMAQVLREACDAAERAAADLR